MKLVVCGGRDFRGRERLEKALDILHSLAPIDLLIEGGADGADRFASEWAFRRRVRCMTIRANWQQHGKAAGPMRNQAMADLKPDLVLAAPGGKGTANMVEAAEDRGIPVIYVGRMVPA